MAIYILGRQAKNRATIVWNCVLIGIFLFLMAIVQTTVLARVKPFGITPDLMIVSVMTLAFFRGCHTGAISGIVAGVMTDALGSVGVSILPLVYFLVGYLIGYYSKNRQNIVYYFIFLAVVLVVRLITTLICALITVNAFYFPTFLTSLALWEMLGTLTFTAVAFFPMWGISAWLRRIG